MRDFHQLSGLCLTPPLLLRFSRKMSLKENAISEILAGVNHCSKRWFPKHVPWTILETPNYFWCPMFSKAGGGWSHVLERNTSLSNYLDWAFNASCPWIGRTCSSRSATIFSLKGQETDLENSEMLTDAFPQVTVNHVFIGST